MVILFGGAALPRFRLLFSNTKIGRRPCRLPSGTQHARPVVGPGIAAPPREYAGTAIDRKGRVHAGRHKMFSFYGAVVLAAAPTPPYGQPVRFPFYCNCNF